MPPMPENRLTALGFHPANSTTFRVQVVHNPLVGISKLHGKWNVDKTSRIEADEQPLSLGKFQRLYHHLVCSAESISDCSSVVFTRHLRNEVRMWLSNN